MQILHSLSRGIVDLAVLDSRQARDVAVRSRFLCEIEAADQVIRFVNLLGGQAD